MLSRSGFECGRRVSSDAGTANGRVRRTVQRRCYCASDVLGAGDGAEDSLGGRRVRLVGQMLDVLDGELILGGRERELWRGALGRLVGRNGRRVLGGDRRRLDRLVCNRGWATSWAGVSSCSCAASSGVALGFSAGLGTAGTGLGAENMLAHVFFAAPATAVAAAATVDWSSVGFADSAVWPGSLDSVAAGVVSQAAASDDVTAEAARGVVLMAPPRPPRAPLKAPRPRSVPRPRPPRTLSPPRRGPSPRPAPLPRRLGASAGTTFSRGTLERERSLAFLGTSANCETAPRLHCQ
jgi:hypothetical protein